MSLKLYGKTYGPTICHAHIYPELDYILTELGKCIYEGSNSHEYDCLLTSTNEMQQKMVCLY